MNEIKNRRSIRRYKTEAVDQKDLELILQAGIYAPSAKNRQPWKYYVYTEGSKHKLLDRMEAGLIRESGENKLLPDSQYGLTDAFHTLQIMRQAPVQRPRKDFSEVVEFR